MPSSRTARYLDVLALRRVRSTFGAALTGRAAYALVFLPLLYAVEDATGSIALAGTAVALYGATASFLAPIRAWFIDRFGARRILNVLVVLFGCTLGGLATTSTLGGSGALLIALATVAGAVAPPLGPTMRVAWGALTPNPDLLRKGLSLDSVLEDLLYLAGPAIAGIGLTFIAPGPALFVPAALVIAGGLLFTATPTIGSMKTRSKSAGSATKGRPLIFEAKFVGLLLPALVAGGISGTVSVAVPVALSNQEGPAAAGLALGLFAGGSALGGLLFGALKIPGSSARQLVVLTAALIAISSLVAVTAGVVAISTVLLAAGAFFSPVMIVAYVAANSAGGQYRQNAATTWVNTSHNVGGSAGSALAGVFLQVAGITVAIGGTVAVSLIVLIISALLAQRHPRRSQITQTPGDNETD